jgi:gamma-tubulin complex component 3
MPVKEITFKICELGWLYCKIQGRLSILDDNDRVCSSQQSFLSEVKQEMHAYYRLIAIIQSHITNKTQPNSISLKRLYVWIRQPLARIRAVSILLDVCSGYFS